MESFESMAYLLQHTALMMMRQADQVLQERLGIGVSQLRILSILRDDPNTSQRKIGDRLGQTEASISRQVKLLTQKGMLVAHTNPSSRREHIAVLTPKGIKLTDAAQEIVAHYGEPLAEVLSSRQREQLTAILETLHQHICVPGKPFACDHALAPMLEPEA